HADREFYYINEQLHKKKVNLEWVPGQEQLADIFTKVIGPKKFNEGQEGLGIKQLL
ncbi:hypothetical protein CROQUDRAFT_70732, partial [Cronartium quercuum f. sp. fusiforme G11]